MKAVESYWRDSLMEREERAALIMMLNEVRKMNCLQRENRKSIDHMRDTIEYYQDVIESTILCSSNNKSIVREIRTELLRLSILANPVTREMYRNTKKPHPDHNEGLIGRDRLPITNIPWIIESTIKHRPESYYLTSTGPKSLEPNALLIGELMNPMKSSKMVVVSLISGGGSGLTTIELVINGKFLSTGELMTVRNSDIALNKKGTTIARLSIESTNEEIEGETIYCIVQASNITISDMYERLILAPGHALTVRLTNRSDQINLVGFNLSWWELPIT